jgi:hypothetical protein
VYTFGAHQKCGFFFKHLTKKVNIEVTVEVKSEMFTLKKKQKLLITATMTLAFVFIISLPYAYASTEDAATAETQSSRTRMLNAKGIAIEKANSQVMITPAGFALALEATEVNETIIKFNVVGGIVRINETEYVITEGNGAVIRDKHGFLLKAQGTSPDGQSVTLKLAGRYFWMWGRLYVARLVGSLQTESVKTALLLRSVIRV